MVVSLKIVAELETQLVPGFFDPLQVEGASINLAGGKQAGVELNS